MSEIEDLKRQVADLNRIVGHFGGFHERSETEQRIEATLNDLEGVEGGRLNDLADLLALLEAGRGRLWKETEYSRHLLGRIKVQTELLRECMGEIGRAKDFKLLEKISMNMVANERDFTQVTDAEKAYDELYFDCKLMLINFAKAVSYPDPPNPDTRLPDFFLLKLIAFVKDQKARIDEKILNLTSRLAVLDGSSCAENMAAGRGPCGCCVTCLRGQITAAQVALGGFYSPVFGNDIAEGIKIISMRGGAAEKQLKKYHDMEAEHPDKECHDGHVSIRFWSHIGPDKEETCPLCALKPKDPNVGCTLG